MKTASASAPAHRTVRGERAKATTILMSLCSQPNYLHVLDRYFIRFGYSVPTDMQSSSYSLPHLPPRYQENSPVLANDIVPGCIRVA